MIDKIQNKESAWKPLLIGLTVVILYKFWKKLSLKFLSGNSDSLYIHSQMAYTFFRAAAAIFGITVLKKYYYNYKVELSLDKFLLFNFIIILPAYFFIRLALFKFGFDQKAFSTELPFNFFTGAFEEIFFRGLIFIGLAHYMKTYWAMILSAILFSLWHFDVIFYWPEYIIIFCWGFYAAICFANGASLFSLTLFHFVWDQIFFGINWEFISDNSAARAIELSAILQICLLIFGSIFVFFKFRQKKRPV
jgi:membrane protease YdiL (CAAX protease family)